jgi:dienelactone hydrolase
MSTLKLTASDGHDFSAYSAGAKGATMGLVVVQEIFGVNSHMRFASDALAESGFAVVCPAIFDRAETGVELGYTPEDIQAGLALRAKITDEQVMLDIEAAAASLNTGSIGIIGYCWGGTIAWWGATRTRRFKAAAGWYGGGIAATKTEMPHCPCSCISAPRITASRSRMSMPSVRRNPASRSTSMRAPATASAASSGRASTRRASTSHRTAASISSASISPRRGCVGPRRLARS